MSRRRTSTWTAAGLPWVRDQLATAFLQQAAHDRAQADSATGEHRDSLMADVHANTLLADRLGAATLWWVSRDMGHAALDASRDIPLLTDQDCPADTGIVAYAHPLPPLNTAEVGTFTATARDGTRTTLTEAPVDALAWTRHGNQLEVRALTLTRRLPGLIHAPAPVQQFLTIGGTLPIDFEALTTGNQTHPADDARPGSTPVQPGSPINALLSLLAATWILAQTPTVASTRTIDKPVHTPTQPRPPAAPDQWVTLIDLRAPQHITTTEKPDTPTRQYTQRWIVRGHWRQQAHGPGRTQRRATWIPSHIKGPPGAPLKTTEHVYIWRR